MTRLRLGFAVNVALPRPDPDAVGRAYEGVIDAAVHAEALGLDSLWVGQHHFDVTPGPVPSPLVLLAAAARHTHRIALGTGITTLPFEQPIRLAEDAVVLDALSEGRLQLGLGTGGANLQGFAAFGLDPAQRHQIYGDRVRELHRLLDDEPIGAPDGPRLSPSGQRVRRALWQAAGTVEEAEAAAEAGDGLQQGAFFDPAARGQAPKVEAYLRRWHERRHDAAPRVAVFRFVHVGDSRDEVVERVAPVLAPRLERMGRRAALSGNDELGTWSTRQYLDRVAHYGTPAEIAASLADDPAVRAGATDIVANFSYGEEFDPDALRRDLDTLAGPIGEALGWEPRRPVR